MIAVSKRACLVFFGNKNIFTHSCGAYPFQPLNRHLGNKAKDSKFFVGSGRKRVGLAPTEAVPLGSSTNVGFKTLLRPFMFTACFSGCSFLGASIWQYESMRKKAIGPHSPRWSVRKRGGIRQQIYDWWNVQTEGQKTAITIVAINCFVFLMWRVPALQSFMTKYFLCSPNMKATCVPMVLSTFSHYSFLHMAANMYVLYTFSTTAVSFFGKEQFVALYCSAGVISSFCSHLYKIVSCSFAPSLGASGALMAILSSSCTQFPDAILQVVFLPFLAIPAGYAIKILMTVDTIGMLAKWKLFDHASHLGGAIFGILYLKYGRDYIWNKRESFMTWWHKIREGR